MDFNLYFKSRQGEMVNLLKNIVGRESPSQDKTAVDACSAFVVGEFKKAGAKITRMAQKKTGDFFIAEYAGAARSPAPGQILILTHIDTVWPVGKISRTPFYISGDRIFGPGALDMKAGLVEAIFALRALHQLNLKPAKKTAVFLNSAEEIGSEASYRLISELARKSSLVLCLEPALPGGGLKMQRKGRAAIRLEVKGRAAHSGTPEKGVNAVEELIVQLERLKRLATSGMTVSINQIGGGEKANIIAESAWAIMDIRFWSVAQKDKILKALRRLEPARPGAKFRFSLDSLTPPMEKTKASAQLFQKAKKIAAAMDIQLTQGKTGGGSDASIASSLGLPTLDGLGPEGEGIHAEHEHLLLSSLVKRTALLTEMLLQL
jgi:glutamate carboxypeptidase